MVSFKYFSILLQRTLGLFLCYKKDLGFYPADETFRENKTFHSMKKKEANKGYV